MYCKTHSHNWKTFKLCHLKLIYHTSHLHVQLMMGKRHHVCSKVHNTESLSTHISWAWQGGQEQDKNWFFWLVMICGNEKQFSVGIFFLHSINWRSWVMPTKLCWCLQLLHHHIQSMLTLPGHMIEEHSRRQNNVTETFSISQNCLILCLRCWSLSPHVPKRQFPRGFGLWFLIPDHMDDKAGYEHLYWVFPMQVGSKLITN
jgi:hypothetical protein